MSGLNSKSRPASFAAGLLAVVVAVAACSGNAATQAPAAGAGTPAVATTVEAKTIGGQSVLVAGSNGMTVYTYTQDVAGSGKSSCSGSCLVKWPALTVPAGTSPTAGPGVTGTLGTITRTENGALQVTYDGLPLYFYQGDSSPGDENGNYPEWNLVKP